MRLTERVLNRATLDRQLLLRRERLDVVEAVHRVVALQAQDPVGPYLALSARIRGQQQSFQAASIGLKQSLQRSCVKQLPVLPGPRRGPRRGEFLSRHRKILCALFLGVA